jgi:hypothetical protein
MKMSELKDEMKEAIQDCKSFENIIDSLSIYISNNFKLKKRYKVYGNINQKKRNK